MIFTVDDILSSGGRHPDRVPYATEDVRRNALALIQRVNALFFDLGIDYKPTITSGFRVVRGIGARRSAHLEGKAVDFYDPGHAIALRITRELLVKHRLRREDTDYTSSQHQDGGISEWCHLDTRTPYKVFRP